MNRLSTAKRARLIRLLVEGNSLRGITRVENVGINTITRLLVDAGEACAAYHDEHVRNVASRRIQVDEMWAFTYAKQRHLPTAKKAPEGAGDTWTWVAIDADSKLIITWLVGPRDLGSAYPFISDLAGRIRYRPQITSDGLGCYVAAVEDVFGADVDFAQMIKLYGKGDDNATTEARYSPPKCLGVRVRNVTGDPDPEHIGTSYVERQNLTVRMSNRRYARLTNAFSKKLRNHEHHNALHFLHYNYCRIHKSLRMSPAMAAGVADVLRDAEWIVELIDERAPEPAKPGPKGPWKHKAQ